MAEEFMREIVYFSELKILFDYSNLNESFQKKYNENKNIKPENIYLFKIYQGSIFFVEDCDFSCERNSSKFKIICFSLNGVAFKKNEKQKRLIKDNNKDFINKDVSDKNKNSKENFINNTDSINKPRTIINIDMTKNNRNILNRKEEGNEGEKIDSNVKRKDKSQSPNKIKNIEKEKKEENLKIKIEEIDKYEDVVKDTQEKDYHKLSFLNIVSTTISKFYQTIRAGENSILNLEKSSISNNLGKSLVFLNPLFLRITECRFEKNYDNVIHCKYNKDENFIDDQKIIIIEKNEISYNIRSGIYIDGILNFPLNLNIFIMNNTIRKNNSDGIFICDLISNFLLISDNILLSNKGMGISIYRVFQRDFLDYVKNVKEDQKKNLFDFENNINNFILLRNNEISGNSHFGMMLNFSNAIFHNNYFKSNESSGLLICNKILDDNKSSENNNNENIKSCNNNSSTKANTISLSNNYSNYFGLSIIVDCSFIRNNGNGLILKNYSNLVYFKNCRFSENEENGLFLDNENVQKVEYYEENKNKCLNSSKQKPIKINKVIWNTDNSLEIKKMNFLKIRKWFDDIIKSTKNLFEKNTEKSNNELNTINFNIFNLIKDNKINKNSFNLNTNIPTAENIVNIFSSFRGIINNNLTNIPFELKDFLIPYITVTSCSLENNSNSGIFLNNCILHTESCTISENIKYSIYIQKEEFLDFFIESKKKGNSIEGNIGGEWGLMNTDLCLCLNSNNRKKKKEKRCEIF